MNWIMIETIAVLIESVLITRFTILYFSYKESKNRLYKNSLLFFMVFTADTLGTFFIKNELTFMIGIITSMIIFSLLFLKGNVFEKILLSIISYSLIYH